MCVKLECTIWPEIFLVLSTYLGCLLRSLPADVIFDNSTGYSFTCDLTDNIGAPWPSSSSMSSLSLCAPGNCLRIKNGFCMLGFCLEGINTIEVWVQ